MPTLVQSGKTHLCLALAQTKNLTLSHSLGRTSVGKQAPIKNEGGNEEGEKSPSLPPICNYMCCVATGTPIWNLTEGNNRRKAETPLLTLFLEGILGTDTIMLKLVLHYVLCYHHPVQQFSYMLTRLTAPLPEHIGKLSFEGQTKETLKWQASKHPLREHTAAFRILECYFLKGTSGQRFLRLFYMWIFKSQKSFHCRGRNGKSLKEKGGKIAVKSFRFNSLLSSCLRLTKFLRPEIQVKISLSGIVTETDSTKIIYPPDTWTCVFSLGQQRVWISCGDHQHSWL